MIALKNASIGYREPVVRADAVFSGKLLLLGPNGSGKTTLFRGIAGLARLFSGSIEIPDFPGLALNLPEALTIVTRIKVRGFFELRADLLRSEASNMVAIFRELGFGEDLLGKYLHKLSSGQLSGVLTSVALGSEAKNVLLDEPFAGLDPARKGILAKILEERDGTLVVSSHETPLLKALPRETYLMFSGELYGPIPAEELLEAGVLPGEHEDAILVIRGRRVVSIVRGRGEPLTRLYSLDQLYLL